MMPSDDARPGDARSDDASSDDARPGDARSDDASSDDARSDDTSSATSTQHHYPVSIKMVNGNHKLRSGARSAHRPLVLYIYTSLKLPETLTVLYLSLANGLLRVGVPVSTLLVQYPATGRSIWTAYVQSKWPGWSPNEALACIPEESSKNKFNKSHRVDWMHYDKVRGTPAAIMHILKTWYDNM